IGMLSTETTTFAMKFRITEGAVLEQNDRIYGVSSSRQNVRISASNRDLTLRVGSTSQQVVISELDDLAGNEWGILIGQHGEDAMIRWNGVEDSGSGFTTTDDQYIYLASSGGTQLFTEIEVEFFAMWR